MPLPAIVAPLIMAAGSALGGAFANKKQTTTSTPTVSPEYSPLQAALLKSVMARLSAPYSLPTGYEAGQIKNINQTYGAAGQNLANRLTARGMGSSPVAANAFTNMAMGRAGQISTMQAGLPLLERQLQTDDLSMAGNLLRTGTGQSMTTPGNMTGGAFTSAADMLAYLYGKGAFSSGKKKTGASGIQGPINVGLGGAAGMI